MGVIVAQWDGNFAYVNSKSLFPMTTIEKTDLIFATLSLKGSTVASMQLVGVSTLNEIIHAVRQSVSSVSGMATLSLRNGSRGGCSTHRLLFA